MGLSEGELNYSVMDLTQRSKDVVSTERMVFIGQGIVSIGECPN
jgi:hypothetical protein